MKNKAVAKRWRPSKELETTGKHLVASAATHPGVPTAALRFQRILVPIDFSNGSLMALEYAVALAHQLQSKLILLHIVEPSIHQDSDFRVSPPSSEANQMLVEAGRKRLVALAEKRIALGLQVEALVRMGHPHSEIPDTARAMAAEMIVVGTHGSTGLEHLVLGSTAERIVRHAPCPVLTVRLPKGDERKESSSRLERG